MLRRPLPLRVRFFLTSALSSLIPLLIAISIIHFNTINSIEEQIAKEAMHIASLAAEQDSVKNAYSRPNPSGFLQPVAEEIRIQTKAAFVVFLDLTGKRLSHPNPELIGQYFTGGDEGPALKGQSYTSKATGISGPSIRAFAPIYNEKRELVGSVAVGFFKPDITLILANIYRAFYVVIPLSLILIGIFSMVLSNNLKKIMLGMEPLEIATLLKEREGMLQSVKEGIIAVDSNSKITMINPAAQNLFPSDTQFLGRHISDLIPDSQLPLVMDRQSSIADEQLLINGNIVLTNRHPLIMNGKVIGAIATFRTLTEVNRIAEELTGVNKVLNALRARSHEFQNKLHVISGLIQLGSYEEAKKFISNITLKEQSLISFLIDNIHVSAVVGLIMGKASEALEKQIQLEVDTSSRLYELPACFDEHALIVVLGNLIENAFDAVEDQPSRKVRVLIRQDEEEICLEVSDSGPGIPQDSFPYLFKIGYTTKEKGQGFGLSNVKNRVDVAGGSINIESNSLGTRFIIKIPYSFS